jgi:hypothetical protein
MQMLQEQLSLPQDKTLIHINRKLNVSNSNKNNVVNYRLIDPISVRKGDSIALYEAFLNIRGQNSQTINILEDITTEIKYMYYVPNDVMANASLDGDFQHATNQIRSCEYKQIPDAKMDMLVGEVPVGESGEGRVQLYENMLDSDRCVPQGSPMIMAAVQPYGSNPSGEAGDKNKPTCVWRTSASNITITAGNYDVNALSEIITEQLNGNEVNNNPFENLLFQQNPKPIDLEKINSVANNQLIFNLQNESNTGLKYTSFSDMVNNEPKSVFTTDPDAPDEGFMCFFDLQTFNKQKDRCEDFYLNGNPGNLYGTQGSYNFFEINEEALIDITSRPTAIDGSPSRSADAGVGLGRVNQVADRRNQTSNTFPDFAICPRNITSDNPFQFFKTKYPDGDYVLDFSIYNPNNACTSSTEPSKKGQFGGMYVCAPGVPQFCGNPWNTEGNQGPTNGNPQFVQRPSDDETNAFNSLKRSNNGRFIGTKSFALTFNGGKANRFAISNLHEPYRIPSVSQSLQNPTVATPMSGNVGEPGTKMIFGGKTNVGFDIFNGRRNHKDGLDLRQFAYNVEASSGITVLGFAWEKVRQTARWQDLNQKLLAAFGKDVQLARCYYFLMNCMPWDWYFEGNERAAKAAWDSTLWAQLGFNYEDIGKVSSRLENYYTQASWFQAIGNYDDPNKTVDDIKKYTMPGIISHNEASLSFTTSLNCLGNIIDINTRATADASNPTLAGTFQTFDTMGSFLDVPGYPGFKSIDRSATYTGDGGLGDGFNLGTFDFGTLSLRYAVVPVLTEPQYIVGSSYPNLAANSNYFIIESDVVQSNYLDPEGSKKTVIGFVSKQESVADTLFSTQGIDFVFKQDRIINDIGIRVTNVDGTDVDNSIINDGSGFIFILQRNSNAIDNYLAVAQQLALEEQGAAGPREAPEPSKE